MEYTKVRLCQRDQRHSRLFLLKGSNFTKLTIPYCNQRIKKLNLTPTLTLTLGESVGCVLVQTLQ